MLYSESGMRYHTRSLTLSMIVCGPAETEHADWVRGKARIGITGGTSTPEVDLEAVRDRIYALTG